MSAGEKKRKDKKKRKKKQGLGRACSSRSPSPKSLLSDGYMSTIAWQYSWRLYPWRAFAWIFHGGSKYWLLVFVLWERCLILPIYRKWRDCLERPSFYRGCVLDDAAVLSANSLRVRRPETQKRAMVNNTRNNVIGFFLLIYFYLWAWSGIVSPSTISIAYSLLHMIIWQILLSFIELTFKFLDLFRSYLNFSAQNHF
jgi:hypothetical protein